MAQRKQICHALHDIFFYHFIITTCSFSSSPKELRGSCFQLSGSVLGHGSAMATLPNIYRMDPVQNLRERMNYNQ